MQMIAALTESNKTAHARMEQQMGLITNLQQTVANLIIQVSDRDSDASTITSNEQRKRRIPHHQSKSSMRRLHLSDAGTVGQINIPPDPGEIHWYIEFPTLESQDEDGNMQQEDTNTDTQQQNTNNQDDTMSQGTEQGSQNSTNLAQPKAETHNTTDASMGTETIDVNGGIDNVTIF